VIGKTGGQWLASRFGARADRESLADQGIQQHRCSRIEPDRIAEKPESRHHQSPLPVTAFDRQRDRLVNPSDHQSCMHPGLKVD
jgi:hypothetical protein